MSDRDPRAELADLSRRLRRVIEREAALGGGELLARAATLRRTVVEGGASEVKEAVSIAAPATTSDAPRAVDSASTTCKPGSGSGKPMTSNSFGPPGFGNGIEMA